MLLKQKAMFLCYSSSLHEQIKFNKGKLLEIAGCLAYFVRY